MARSREAKLTAQARYREKNREDLRAKGRAYAAKRRAEDPEFAERGRERIRQLGREQPEHLAAIRKRSYEKHAEKRRAERRVYREANLEKVRQYDRERYIATRVSPEPYQAYDLGATPEERAARKALRDKAWRDTNRERYRINHANSMARRRARLQGCLAEQIDRREVFARDGGRCHICGRRCSPKKFHLDHLIPIAHGGSHTYENVAVAHPFCNLKRGAGRMPAQLRLVS